MRRWGILVSAVYLLLLYLLFTPVWSLLAGDSVTWLWEIDWSDWDLDSENWAAVAIVFLPMLALLISQVILFVSVDRSFRRPMPRASLKRTIWATALATGLLTAGALTSMVTAIDVAVNPKTLSDGVFWLPLSFVPAWIIWGLVFNRYVKDEESLVHKLVSRLLVGSVLELLIAIPCHVYARQRSDCSAPFLTGWGIVTGIAVMLLAFGPGVLLLYRKRLAQYKTAEQ